LIDDNYLMVYPQQFSLYCEARRFWIAYFLGFFLWISCIIIRFIRLHVIIVQHKTPIPTLAYLGILLSPIFVYCLVTLFVPSDVSCLTLINDEEFQVRCSVTELFLYMNLALHACYFIISVIFVFLLRNIRKSFNEYNLLRFQVLVGVVFFIVIAVLSYFRLTGVVYGRSVMTLGFVVIVSSVQYIGLGKCVYLTIFHREPYLKRFRERLDQDSRDHVNQKLKNPSNFLNSKQSSNNHSEGSKGTSGDQPLLSHGSQNSQASDQSNISQTCSTDQSHEMHSIEEHEGDQIPMSETLKSENGKGDAPNISDSGKFLSPNAGSKNPRRESNASKNSRRSSNASRNGLMKRVEKTEDFSQVVVDHKRTESNDFFIYDPKNPPEGW